MHVFRVRVPAAPDSAPGEADTNPVSASRALRGDAQQVGYSSMPSKGPRRGYRSVTPRIVVEDVWAQVEFLRTVFGGTGSVEPGRPAEIRIGDALVMVSPAVGRDLFPAFLYVYVDDADLAYGRALRSGAVSLEEPLDTPYGDRRAMVRDPFGNVFQIAHEIT
jgi:PhnB protein